MRINVTCVCGWTGKRVFTEDALPRRLEQPEKPIGYGACPRCQASVRRVSELADRRVAKAKRELQEADA